MAIPSIKDPDIIHFLQGVDFVAGLFLEAPEAAGFKLHISIEHDPEEGWQPHAVVRRPNAETLAEDQLWKLRDVVYRVYPQQRFDIIKVITKFHALDGIEFTFDIIEREANGAQIRIELGGHNVFA